MSALGQDRQVSLFISYAREDDPYRSALETVLATLKRQGLIQSWSDRRIVPGEKWTDQIDGHLRSAELVVLLVSPDYVASDYCYESEMKEALERHRCNRTKVIPILVRPTDLANTPVAALQMLPRDGKAISVWRNRDEAWLEVAQALRDVLSSLNTLAECNSPRQPLYADNVTRRSDSPPQDLGASLVSARQRLERLTAARASEPVLQEVRDHIRVLRREMREGGQLRPGDMLSERYLLIERLGAGGFATVWKARDESRLATVAVKVLHGQFAHDRSYRDRLFRGAQQMWRLNHPGIVRVIEPYCEDDGFYYFVMDYCPGGDFRCAIIRRWLKPDFDVVSGIICSVGAALNYAHSQGCVHRDVKPANILLSQENEAWLTDFDLVHVVDSTGGTRSGALGSFIYAAPEALHSARMVDARSDVYSLAMTAIFGLYGGDIPIDVVQNSRGFISRLNCPLASKKALERATEWDRERRFSDVASFCTAFSGHDSVNDWSGADEHAAPSSEPKNGTVESSDPAPDQQTLRLELDAGLSLPNDPFIWLERINRLIEKADDTKALALELIFMAGDIIQGRSSLIIFRGERLELLRDPRHDGSFVLDEVVDILRGVRDDRAPYYQGDVLSTPLRKRPPIDRSAARSLACLPVIFQGECMGALCLEHSRPDVWRHQVVLGIVERIVDALRELVVFIRRYDLDQTEASESYGLIGISESMRKLRRGLDHISRSKLPDLRVLLLGDDGIGKAYIAEVLHRSSSRKDGPFVAVSCSSINPHLFGVQMFGVVRGAYTGVSKERAGLAEQAKGGTLFLEDIEYLPIESQLQLLGLLDHGRFSRVGEAKERAFDAHLIIATGRDLNEEVRTGRVRADLLSRITRNVIKIPSLRERGAADIALLARSMITQLLTKQKDLRNDGFALGLSEYFTRSAERLLLDHPWPGNMRQMVNVFRSERIQQTLLAGEKVTEEMLREVLDPFPGLSRFSSERARIPEGLTLAQLRSYQDLERARYIREVYESLGRNGQAAARALECSRMTIFNALSNLSREKA